MTVLKARVAFAALAAIVGTGVACGDYARNNPFDPGILTSARIDGPDSTVSFGDTLRYRLRVEPDGARPAVLWQLQPTANLFLVAQPDSGVFVLRPSIALTLDPVRLDVRATVAGGRTVSKVLILHLRIAGLDVSFCRPASFEPIKEVTLRIGEHEDACPVLTDARHNILVGLFNLTTGVPRDPAIVESQLTQIYARSAGSTWVVFRANGFSDSVRVTVRP